MHASLLSLGLEESLVRLSYRFFIDFLGLRLGGLGGFGGFLDACALHLAVHFNRHSGCGGSRGGWVTQEANALSPVVPVFCQLFQFFPRAVGGGVHEEVSLLAVIVYVLGRPVHHPLFAHAKNMPHPLKAAGSYPRYHVKRPRFPARLLSDGLVGDVRYHAGVGAI